MSITREQVADLRPGDVVEFRIDSWPQGAAIRGPLITNEAGVLAVPIPGDGGGYWLRDDHGHAFDGERRSLTVISRAPRPLYVNHPRTKPVHGDIVHDGDNDAWQFIGGRWMLRGGSARGVPDISDCAPLTLLWDGETGQVVP